MNDDQFRQIARVLIIIILFACAIVTRLITKLIGNYKLSKSANYLFKVLFIVCILRVIAIWLDTYTNNFAVFSTLISLGTYLYVFYLAFRFYLNLKARDYEIHKTDGSIIYSTRLNKDKLNQSINDVFDELKISQKKTNILKNQIEKELKSHNDI